MREWVCGRRADREVQIQRLAWLLLGSGSAVIVGAGVYSLSRALFTTTIIPVWFKIALGAIVAGLLLLLFSVLWERFWADGKEPYKEIKQ